MMAANPNREWLTDAELICEAESRKVRTGDAAAVLVIAIIGVIVIGGWLIGWAMGALS